MISTFITTVTTAVISISTITVPSNESSSWFDNYHFENYYQHIPEEPIIHEPDAIDEDVKQKYLYTSEKLFDLLRKKPECFNSKNFIYHYLFFCSTIWHRKNVDKRNKEKEYVNINYKTMIEIVSKFIYSEMVENLKIWNVIEESPHGGYQVGNNSKSYKLKAPFDTNIKKIPIEDKLINKKLNRFKMKKQKEIQKLPSPYQYLSITNKRIRIDDKKAHEYNYFKKPDYTKLKTYDFNYYSISTYADEDYRFYVDPTGNRAHTNLTNLSSGLRQFLSVDGEPLGQVDISNSQPLFFYLHIKDLSFIPQSEKDNYRAIVESGMFYEYFMEKLKIPAEKRKKVKSKILTAIFFDKYRRKEGRYIKVFKQDFPNILAYIKTLRKRDYKQLAGILQKTESKFVIENVVAKFMREFKENEFIATIHDSIVVKSSMLNSARKIMSNCFWDAGINPNLKIENFNPQ